MTNLIAGRVVVGSVTGIEPYGIFVNLDEYYNGLIHISEISNGFVRDINDFVTNGEKIYVKIIDINEDTFQVRLSIKDINYKIKRQDRRRIAETRLGFSNLRDNLPKWIEDKLMEINCN